MLIRIIYKNNLYDMIKPYFIDNLIKSDKVKMFLRSEGWVFVGCDKIRTKNVNFTGPDRRKNFN